MLNAALPALGMPVSDPAAVIADGTLARIGLLPPAAQEQAVEAIGRAGASGLETVRLLFADQHGILRGKTLVAGALASAFARGVTVPSTLLLKDTSHRTAFPVWNGDDGGSAAPMRGVSDVLLVPDPATFRPLPWAPHSAWMLCDVVARDGGPIAFAARHVLRTAIDRLHAAGMAARFGLEMEFHVFAVTEPALDHADTGMPARPPRTRALTPGWQLLTETLYAGAEPVLDELRRAAQGLGLPVRSVEAEIGPSQFEFTFDPADPMTQADAMVMFRTMVKEVCAARGLHASFMAKPRLDNIAACGWHIHQSVTDAGTGRNLFMPDSDGGNPTVQAAGWIAGLLTHARASSLLTAPTVNSYKRYQPFQLAPDRVQWGWDNRGAMVRALMAPGDAASRVENRAPDTTANPYYALAAQILSGLDGIAAGRVPPPATETPYAGDAERLPATLAEAIDAFDGSALYRDALGGDFVDYLVRIKRFEWNRYLAAVSEWEQAEYFALY